MAELPAGMRNNNPGNIKYVGQSGTTPSINTDQGDPQAVFATPEAGMTAMYQLLSRKYGGGKVTPAMIIAGQGGWTPGNMQAAQNVANTMGIGVNDDIGMTDPARAHQFMRALMLQEHGQASLTYTDQQIDQAITGATGTPAITTAQQQQPQLDYGINGDSGSSLADTLAPRVKLDADEVRLRKTKVAPPPTFDFATASAVPPPAQEPALAAPAAATPKSLADLFQVADIGRPAQPLPTVDYGRQYLPRRRRDYG